MNATAVAAAPEKLLLESGHVASVKKLGLGLMGAGAILTGLMSLFHSQRFWAAYLIAFAFLFVRFISNGQPHISPLWQFFGS